jgi:plastocyanin
MPPETRSALAALALTAALSLSLAGCEDNGGDQIIGVGGGGPGPAEAEILEIVEGDLQNGRTLEVLPLPLTVAASDSRGEPVEEATVRWEVSGGVGTLSAVETLTDVLGEADVLLTLGPLLGVTQVRATVAGADAPAVEFTVFTTVVQVSILIDSFEGPFGEDSVQVVVGDTIEWVNRDGLQHGVLSTVEPPGGAPFNSNRLRNSERFRFVPKAEGLWQYIDPFAPDSTPPVGKIHAVLRTTVGSLKVVTSTTGSNIDPLYAVTVDGQFSSSIGPSDDVTFPSLTSLDHVVRLLEVDLNCQVQGDNPRIVTVRADETVETTFDVTCE